MTKIQAIRDRHSVRHYKNIPIESEKISAIKEEIEKINTLTGLNVQLVINDTTAFSGFMAHYGDFKGVSNYIAMVGHDSHNLEEKIGYYGERLVIKAGELGLNTCWVALTYSKRKTHVEIGDHERLVCVIALGYGETQGEQHKSKPIEKIASLSDDDPDWYRIGIEMARLAPTAMNQQRYYIERQDDVVKINPGFGFYTKVDVGIVRYHFEVGAGKNNFTWFNEEKMLAELHDDEEDEEEEDVHTKNVVILSSSPRIGGNSDRLCEEFARGARETGHEVEIIRVADKKIGFCTGCYACTKTHQCVQRDDMDYIIDKLLKADVIVFSSPVYFYNMTAQLKVCIDRLIPCYEKIRADIYLIATGWDTNLNNLSHALEAIRGLTHDCFVHCEEKGRIIAGGVNKIGDIEDKRELVLAYQMGRNC